MNSITIAGALGKDAEPRTTHGGDYVLTFSVADSQGRDKPTIWWSCEMWGKRAQALAQYLIKGQSVTVVGAVTEREWQDKDGTPRKSMNVKVNEIALQGGQRQSAPAPAPQRPAPAPRASSGFDDFDDAPF